MKIILDTNGFIRVLLNDLPSQVEQVEQLFIKAKNKIITILVPQIIIFEIEFTLNKFYGLTKEDVTLKLDSILNTPYFKIQDKEIFTNCLKIFKENNLSFVDCFLMAKAKQENSEIFSFDNNLTNAFKNI